MRVVIVHDWLTSSGGAELVLKEMLAVFPDADLMTVVDFLPEEQRDFLKGKKPITTFIQRLPFARGRYRGYLALMPIAIEQLDIRNYDLVISSSYAVAKGVLTGPDQLHISYVHSPIRYAWDLQPAYLTETKLNRGLKSILARVLLHYIRIWDARTANGVDRFVVNSAFVGRRVAKAYGRRSTVINPPVDLERFSLSSGREDFYVTASRMVPYKRIPMIAEAFSAMPDRRLVILGEGPEMSAVRRVAGSNVTILGRQPDHVVADHFARAKAFVFAAEEDFGIVPIEAQACGTPVIAFGRGGALETIRGDDGPDQTGIFFNEQTPAALIAAVNRFEGLTTPIDSNACRANAERFGAARFRVEFAALVADAMADRGNCGRW